MQTIVIFLLCATTLRAFAAPAEEALVKKVEVKEEAAVETAVVDDLPPLAPEVHSSLCLNGWEFFRGYCYYLNIRHSTWTEAAKFCQDYGATLASVHSPLQNNHFQHMAGSAGYDSVWTGGYHFEDSWRWQDGSYVDYDQFQTGCNDGKINKCILMSTNPYSGGWSSSACSCRAPFICGYRTNC